MNKTTWHSVSEPEFSFRAWAISNKDMSYT